MNVSVVIPTLNRSDLLDQAVTAVRDTTDAEVVVRTDEDRDGFAATCNRGAKEAAGEVLVFLNDDTVVQPGWLAELRPHAMNGPVGAHLVYPDGTTQHSGVFLRRRGQLLEAYNRTRPAKSGEVPAVTGACLAITAEHFEALGGFDKAFVNGYEDVDLCLRARRDLGLACWYAADSTVVHLESQSDPEARWGHVRANVDLLNERWGDLPI